MPSITRPATRPTSFSFTSSRWPIRSRPWASTARRSRTRSKTVADRRRGLHHRRQHAVLLGQVLHPDRLDPGRPQVRRLRAGAGQARRRPPEAGRQPRQSGAGRRSRHLSRPRAGSQPTAESTAKPRRASRADAKPAAAEVTPATFFALLPAAGPAGRRQVRRPGCLRL